ncbi:MAG TPA: prepilin-type N-terminal cleavage/methylation domain-containing protein [Actinokineospora sp.]|nr:prepilin-type N-terminal cleavage/methylation domain-containing protein [Actinokineospora sp.]
MNSLLERAHQARKNQNGFTLIELLMVIVILGVLAGIVVFAVSGINDQGEKSACLADVKTLEVAEEAHYAKEGSYATDIAALVSAGLLHAAPDPLPSGTTITAGVVVPGANCT